MSTDDVADRLAYPEDPADFDYPWVVAWGRLIGLEEEQIRRQVELARLDRAPVSAIYRWTRYDPWHTLDEVNKPETRWRLMDYATNFDLTLPHHVLMHWLDPDYRVPEAG